MDTHVNQDTHIIDQEWFKTLLNLSLDCVVAIDVADNVVEFNYLAEAVFGYDTAEVLGKPLPELIIPPRYRELHRSSLAHYLKTGEGNIIGRRVEIMAMRKSGEEFPVELTVLPIDCSGKRYFISYLRDISDRKNAEQKITTYLKQLEATMEGTLLAVASMVEMRDPYTAGHERRVGLIAEAIARELGWEEERCHYLNLVGIVHDIGKIAIPAEILSCPRRLTPIEYEMIKGHPQKGYEILKGIDFPLPIGEIICQHHERMDGQGYPKGLKGDEILVEARILAVADVLEAMASHRPYRAGLGIEAALAELDRHRGSHYDPVVVDAIMNMVRNKGFALPE